MTARLGFVDLLQNPEFYSTRTIADSTTAGAAVGTLPASNLFNRNLGKPWKRTGLATGDVCKLDLDLVRVRPDGQAESGSPQCAGIGMIVLAGISVVTSSSRYPYQIDIQFHATTNAFADSGGTNPYTSTNYALGPPYPGAIRSLAMCPVAGYSDTTGGVPYDFGSSGQKIGRYIRIFLTPYFTGGGTCDVSIGRIMVMQTLRGVNALSGYKESAQSNSEVVTAYDGTPYTLPRPTSRVIGFSMPGMYGGRVRSAQMNVFSSTMAAANRYSGTTNDAVFVIEEDPTLAASIAVTTVGRLSAPLSSSPEVPGQSGLDLNTISGEVIETPF